MVDGRNANVILPVSALDPHPLDVPGSSLPAGRLGLTNKAQASTVP